MPHTRIFFWRYFAVGVILVLTFGSVAGLVATLLAYWPVLRSAKRSARRQRWGSFSAAQLSEIACALDHRAEEPMAIANGWAGVSEGLLNELLPLASDHD